MGIACMEVSQAGSSNIGPLIGPPPFAKPRSGMPGWIDLPASRPVNSGRTAAPRDLGKEWAVVQQAIAGNVDAQEHLFAPHVRKLYRTVLALLKNKEDAEDALQEGLCKAFTSLRSFQGRSSFSTWLTRIVINSALMARRRKSAHPEASLDEMLDYQPQQMPRGFVDPRPDPEELYVQTEFNTWIEGHVSQLPPGIANGLSTLCSIRLFRAAFRQGAWHLGERHQIADLSGAIEAGRWAAPIARGWRDLARVEKTWLSES